MLAYKKSTSNSSKDMKEIEIEDFLTAETKSIVGRIMPILEAENISLISKSNIKSMIWNFKDNIQEKLIKESNNDKSNK